jgi:hypothetical protein
MSTVDATTWQAVGLTLTVVGLALSVLVLRRRGPAAGLRAAAWSLLPLAAGLTGTLRLVWRIGVLVVDWAARLVFSPFVWVGLGVLGVSVLLFLVSGLMRARGVGGRSGDRTPRRAASVGAGPAPSPARERGGRAGRAEPAVQDKDMDDIEAILRKHGIS